MESPLLSRDHVRRDARLPAYVLAGVGLLGVLYGLLAM
jgi:hypothetical protein